MLSLPPAAALPIDDLKVRIKTERLEGCFFFLREKKAKTKGKSTEFVQMLQSVRHSALSTIRHLEVFLRDVLTMNLTFMHTN